MRDDHRGRRLADFDQAAQFAVVGLHVRLARRDALALEPELAEIKGHLPLLRQRILGARVLRNEYAHHADATGGLDCLDQVVHGEVGHFVAVQVAALVADALATTVGTLPARQFQNARHTAAFGVVDRDRPDPLGQLQTVLVGIDHHHLAGALDRG